jgi:bifunctional DNA-binding transcriptional regulator/antitoxin component of YhaV-PrlF toxin-antitoxin module
MEKFTLRVASKRQVTIPVRLLELLQIEEGDVLEFTVEGSSLRGRGLKLVPSSFFTQKMLEELRTRELDMDTGIEVKDTDELVAKFQK